MLIMWDIFVPFLGCLFVFSAVLRGRSEVDMTLNFTFESMVLSGLPTVGYFLRQTVSVETL